MRETRCSTFELWSLLGRLLAQPMLAVCLAGWCIRPSSHTICVMVPSILPMVAWRVALGCSCIWLLYVALRLLAVTRPPSSPVIHIFRQ